MALCGEIFDRGKQVSLVIPAANRVGVDAVGGKAQVGAGAGDGIDRIEAAIRVGQRAAAGAIERTVAWFIASVDQL